MAMIGIYRIVDNVDNRIYIGKSKDIKTRIRKHKYRLNRGIHHNRYLQRAWDKHGAEEFKFEILEECTIEELEALERYYIYVYNSFEDGFNMSIGGEGCLGYKHTDEERENMKYRNTGGNNPGSRKVICENIVFDTIRECANYYNIKEKTMHKWLCGYRSIREDFKEKGLRYL